MGSNNGQEDFELVNVQEKKLRWSKETVKFNNICAQITEYRQ